MSFDYLVGYIMSISMYMQNFITIFHSVQEIGPFSLFSEFGARQSLDRWKNVISQSLGLDLVNINFFAKVYKNIPLSSRDRAIFTFFFRIWRSAKPRPMINVILQFLDLDLVNINVSAKFYQNIPNGLRVIDIFHEQAGDKMFTNGPRTKSSQTVRWQNQMFDYRAPYEIQLQVSVDFLRVVQSPVRPAKTQISLSIRQFWSESSLSAWRKARKKAQADLCLRWVHMPFCWFCHEAARLFSTHLQVYMIDLEDKCIEIFSYFFFLLLILRLFSSNDKLEKNKLFHATKRTNTLFWKYECVMRISRQNLETAIKKTLNNFDSVNSSLVKVGQTLTKLTLIV